MFVIIFSNFYVSNQIMIVSLTIKTVSVSNIRKEIYSHLKTNKICGFPLITNYIDKYDLSDYNNNFNNIYINLKDNLDKSMFISNINNVININSTKCMSKEEYKDIQLVKLFMNNIVINVSSLLSKNINKILNKTSHFEYSNLYKLEDDYKKIRLADKYINNFITSRSDISFTYRLYRKDEERKQNLSNSDFINLMNIN